MPLLDDFINQLQQAQTEADFQAIEVTFRADAEKLPYCKAMAKAISGKDPKLGLALLIRLYTADVRDLDPKTNNEHLIQTLILLNWTEGLAYLLKNEPRLIDIPVLSIETSTDSSKQKVEVNGTLLQFALEKKSAQQIIQIIMDAKPNLSLIATTTGFNIVQKCAWNEDLANAENLDLLLNNASLEVLNAEAKRGETPYELAVICKNQIFIDKFKAIGLKRFGQAAMDRIENETLDRVSVYWAAPEFFTRTRDDKRKYLKGRFSPPLTQYNPVMLLSSLIGKDLARQEKSGHPVNARVFANKERLSDYLIKMYNQENGNFIVNAILFVPLNNVGGAHAVNIFCIKINAEIHAVLIDGTGDCSKHCATLEADLTSLLAKNKIHFSSIHSKTRIQYNKLSGCQTITVCLAGKLSRLTVEEAEILYTTLKAKSENGAVHLGDFPLWLGMLGIAQSLEAITHEKQRIPEGEFDKPDYRKFEERLARGTVDKFCVGYTSLVNKKINVTLEQKKENQKKHAIAATGLSNEQLLEAVAIILGLKVTSDDWKRDIKLLIPEIASWGDLSKHKPPTPYKL